MKKKKTTMFKYFKQESADGQLQPFTSTEHFLNATELAVLFKVFTDKGKPNPIRMRKLIESSLGEYPRYYYDYGPRLMRVYPLSRLLETEKPPRS